MNGFFFYSYMRWFAITIAIRLNESSQKKWMSITSSFPNYWHLCNSWLNSTIVPGIFCGQMLWHQDGNLNKNSNNFHCFQKKFHKLPKKRIIFVRNHAVVELLMPVYEYPLSERYFTVHCMIYMRLEKVNLMITILIWFSETNSLAVHAINFYEYAWLPHSFLIHSWFHYVVNE